MHVHGVHTARPRRMCGEARHSARHYSARQHARRTHALQVMLREDAGGVFIASLPASDAGDERHKLREGEYVLRLNGLDVYSPSEPPARDGVPLSLQESGASARAAL